MRDDFYIVLLSNSSMPYYPQNTTSHFITKLPQHINLTGEWAVALIDINFPLNFQNVSKNEENRRVTYGRSGLSSLEEIDGGIFITQTSSGPEVNAPEVTGEFCVPPGIYNDLSELLKELNSNRRHSHIEFSLKPGFYVSASRVCGNKIECLYENHCFNMSKSLKKILGFDSSETRDIEIGEYSDVLGEFPASINNDLPSNLLVYTDICQPYVTGDVYSRLLRSVTLDLNQYAYGRSMSVNFPRPVYIPLLCTSFQTIEILIRNEVGLAVPFDFGTATLTLHFKRV